MIKGEKVVLLNDILLKLDELYNGEFYEQETHDTGVIYMIYNLVEDKAYIGKAYSYVKNGNQKIRRHGAKDRFYKHWMAAHNSAEIDCPIFYDALRNSDLHDWVVFTIHVCPKNELKFWETELVKKYDTSNPEFGYNYFVGDNKPNNKQILAKYQKAKANSNVNRAKNGEMRNREWNKGLPPNIYCRIHKDSKGKIHKRGYFVRIKINGDIYTQEFTSKDDSMEEKLALAKKQLKLFKKEATKKANKKSGSKSQKAY